MNDMPPKIDPEQRDRRAREWADAIPDDADQDNAYEATYRDGSLRNECWNDSAWRDDQ